MGQEPDHSSPPQEASSTPQLKALIFAQPLAKLFSGEPLALHMTLPERLPPGRRATPDEIGHQFSSQYLRPSDVPLAFHRESPGMGGNRGEVIPYRSGVTVARSLSEMSERLEAFGRMLQYRFDDGLVLTGHQILYHPYSKHVARHLLPLAVNVKSDVQGRAVYSLESGPRNSGFRSTWHVQAEQVILSVLMSGLRVARLAARGEDDGRGPQNVYFTLDENIEAEREVMRLDSLELLPDEWGPWRLTTALPTPTSGVHYGRARLELDPAHLASSAENNSIGLARSFWVDTADHKIVFHTFEDQLTRLKLHIPKPLPAPVVEGEEASVEHQSLERPHTEMLESNARGISLHLSGHANIQATTQEISDVLIAHGGTFSVFPEAIEVEARRLKPRLSISGDGTFKFITRLEAPGGPWEVHGIPKGMAYLLFNFQGGLGATTGYANTQLAHARRGLKRERDMKILRNLGYSLMIFYEAASYALGQTLSDGSRVKSERELCDSLFERLGALVLKSEGWPVQSGSLAELCSKNVTTLIEGFVAQVVRDIGVGPHDEGREISLYLPEGELKVRGLSRNVVLLFHAFVSDLVSETGGACFTRARTKYFETFMNDRGTPDSEDVAVRLEVDPETAAKLVFQPGIGERYRLPEASLPPKGMHVFNLLSRGFEISIDGKHIEEFNSTDFRPEFTLRENDDSPPPDATDAELNALALGARKINWFELHPKFFFKGVEITGEQAGRLSKDGMLEFQGKLFRVREQDMPSLKRLTQFWSSIQSGAAKLDRAKRRKTEDTYLQLPRSQTLELLALRATGVKIRGGPKWDEITAFYDRLDGERDPLKLPESFKAELQPYQIAGVQWLRDLEKLGLGAILADDMGLGKTVTTLAFLESARANEKMGACLVMVPTSLTFNWLSEAERFAPEMPVTIFNSRAPESALDFLQSNRGVGIVICTYGLLQEHAQLLQQIDWNCIVFDEAQNLKNITTKRTTAARLLRGQYKICLTGTPLENHYGEFYSLFDLIVPGSLGGLPEFREKYVNPVRVLREDLDFLKLKSRPLLLRRTKSQVMSQLPPKIETTIKLPFEEEQKRIYRDIAASYNDQIRSQIASNGEASMQLQMLTALLRLRQACSDPSAIPGVKYSGEPPKISTLVEAITEITEGGASALVFTQFLSTFERIRTAFAIAKVPFYDISGADSRIAREKKLKGFQEETRGSVMLMTLKTGGVGLNLTKASYVFHIEPWWNPAVENQATDRAHRIGQLETVQVYRYLIKESVEEKIELLKDIKAKRFDALFSETERESDLSTTPASNSLSQKDFEYLLS